MRRLSTLSIPQVLLAVLVATTGLAFVVAASTSGAAFGAYNAQWDGAAELRTTSEDLGIDSEIVRNVSAYEDASNRSVAVVLSPDRAYTEDEAATLRRFVERGGTLVVAEDFGEHSNPLLAAVGAEARVNGSHLRDEVHNYRSPAMPVATNLSTYPLMTGVGTLTLNHGTVVDPHGARVTARSSEFGYLDQNRNGGIDDTESLASRPVMTVEDVGAGRVVVISDPSLFINTMLERPGNERFVFNLLGAHERVLLDYSHAESLPPLSLALLVIRESTLLQVGLLTGMLALVVVWGRGDFARLRSRFEQAPPDSVGASPEALTAYLTDKHPEWDDDAVRRVTKGVLAKRHEREDNE
jgi:hypothetical protein